MNLKALLFILLLLLSSISVFPVRALPPTVNSGWTSTPPTIDGAMGVGEWSAAGVLAFTLLDFGGNPTPYTGTMNVMNDGNNLYVAVLIQAGDASSDRCEIVFDEDNDGFLAENDDAFGYGSGPWGGFQDKHWDPYFSGTGDWISDSGPGDPHGGGAAIQDGGTLIWTFELAHPLCSGDLEDFCLFQGSKVGFQIWFTDGYADSKYYWWPYEGFGEIVILKGPKSEPQPPVGGEIFQVDKSKLLTPYITAILVIAVASTFFFKKWRRL